MEDFRIANDIIQVDYQKLEDIARLFAQQTEECIQLSQRIKEPLKALQNSGWEGSAAKAFLTEVNEDIFPTMKRLSDSLFEGERMTMQIAKILQDADEEATNAGKPIASNSANSVNISSIQASANRMSRFKRLAPRDPGPGAYTEAEFKE